MKKYIILSILIITLLTIGFASASDNLTQQNKTITDNPLNETITTQIQSHNITKYYKEDSQLITYLKDTNNQPIQNKTLSISINNQIYNKTTDNTGKITLNLNLKPNSYIATITFAGDENYTPSKAIVNVKINTANLKITTNDYKTYWHSDLFFKAKIINKITKKPVANVKVQFKVYITDNKYKLYYATTNSKGIAKLKKNFKIGKYKIITSIKDENIISKKSKSSLTVKKTAETGCSSLYVQVSKNEAVTGFRRDATNAKTIHIVKCKINGKKAIKQYKTNSYFFHSITTADGWMAGTGGRDNPNINHAIEKLVGKMFKSGKIKRSYLNKIQRYERILGIGHFSIKAPNGKYALVWSSTIKTGKLKSGQYLSVPNGLSSFRSGTWAKFNKNPAKAATKIAATDPFGVNRRDVTIFHWKATTNLGKTTSTLKVYAANDNGHLIGRNTGYLKDNIYFKGKFFSKNKLPKTPSSILLGVHNFKSIDKLIKKQTNVKTSDLIELANGSKTFNITVRDVKTNNPIAKLKIKIKIGDLVYTVKTNSKGLATFVGDLSNLGDDKIIIYSGNNKYYISDKIKIE